jgi:hypothetical protein
VNAIDWAALIAAVAAVALALIAAVHRTARYLVDNDYVVSASGNFKFAKRPIPVPKVPAPRVVILPGDGVPDPLDRDYVVRGGKF